MDNVHLQLSAGQMYYGLVQCAKTIHAHEDLLNEYSRACLEPAGGSRLAQTFTLIIQQLSWHEPYQSLTGLVEALQLACVNAGHTLGGQVLCAALRGGSQNWSGKSFLTPVDLLTSLRAACQAAGEAAVLGTQRPALVGVCETVDSELAQLDTFTAEQVCATALTSAQSYLVDNPQVPTGNATTVGLGLVLAALCDLCAQVEGNVGAYVQVLVQMIRDMTAARVPRGFSVSHGGYQPRFEVSFKIVALAAQWEQILSQLQRSCSEVVCFGQVDPFGLGQWSLSAHTTSALALWSLPGVRSLRVTDLNDQRRRVIEEEPVPQVSDNVTLLVPRHRRQALEIPNLQITAGTVAPSLVEALAQAGAQVLLHPQPADLQWAGASEGNLAVLGQSNGAHSDGTQTGLVVACAPALQDCPQKPDGLILTQGPAQTLIVCEQLATWLGTLPQHFPQLAALPAVQLASHAHQRALQILENCAQPRPGTENSFTQRLAELLDTARGQKNAVLCAVLGTESTPVERADLEYTVSQYPQVELRMLHGGQSGGTSVCLWQGR